MLYQINQTREITMSEPTKTIVITGTSSGFGEGAVRDFADRGYRVWGTMRDVNGRNATKKAALEHLNYRNGYEQRQCCRKRLR